MILNLLRVEGLRVEDMMRRSFAEHHAQRAAPEAAAALARGRAALARLRARPWPASPLGTRREEVEEYAALSERAEALGAGAHAAAMASRGAAAALAPGRVVLAPGAAPGATEVGVVLEAREGGPGGGTAAGAEGGARAYVVLSLHRASPLDALAAAGGAADTAAAPAAAAPAAPAAHAAPGAPEPMRLLRKKDDDLDAMMGGMRLAGKKGGGSGGFGAGGGFGARAPAAAAALPLPRAGEAAGLAWRLAELPAAQLAAICKVKVRADAASVLAGDAAATAAAVAALAAVRDVAAAAGGDPPAMDPVADLKVASLELVGALRERSALLARRAALAPHADPLLPEMLAAVRSERALAVRLAAAAAAAGDAGLAQLPEYGVRVRVLQRLGYLDAGRSVTLKGRVACEINTGDELVGTEILFGGLGLAGCRRACGGTDRG
jgi:antiviral helicase SKI2